MPKRDTWSLRPLIWPIHGLCGQIRPSVYRVSSSELNSLIAVAAQASTFPLNSGCCQIKRFHMDGKDNKCPRRIRCCCGRAALNRSAKPGRRLGEWRPLENTIIPANGLWLPRGDDAQPGLWGDRLPGRVGRRGRGHC